MLENLDPNLLAAIGLFIVFFISFATIKTYKKIQSSKLKKRLSKGVEVEKKAAELLKKNGYKVVKYHYRKSYELKKNEEKVTINIEADYIVKRRGKRFIAEVKSGDAATEIKNSATRRQMLEYSLFIENDGLLLVDMENQKISKIEFPYDAKHSSFGIIKFIFSLVLGIFLGWYLFHQLAF